MPDRLSTKIVFSGTTVIPFIIGQDVGSLRYRPSGAFDVDPLLGSTATPGFAEWASIYASYRVVQSTALIQFSQTGSQPVTAILVPLNADPGATPSFVTVSSWVGNPYQKSSLLPNIGGPLTSLSMTMSTEKIFGSKMVYFDDNFSSLVTAVPANNWWWALGIIISPAATVVFNVNVYIKIAIDIEFFDRKVLLS
jgi:hypothetical protein